jgi:hypothetical protein
MDVSQKELGYQKIPKFRKRPTNQSLEIPFPVA